MEIKRELDEAVKLHHDNGEGHFKELWENFHRFKNMEIVGKSNAKISTSSILLSICSQVVHEAMGDILRERELDLEDKMVLILPDFSNKSISNLVDYFLGRTVAFESFREERELLELLEILWFRQKHESQFEIEEDHEPKVLVEEDVKQESEEEWKPKGKKRRRYEPWYKNCQPLEDDETETSLKCEGCDIDISRLNFALKHLEDLTREWNMFDFREKRVFRDGLFKCPICQEFKFEKKSQARFHLQDHIQEIHNDVRFCKVCTRTVEYQSVQKYMSHLFRHVRVNYYDCTVRQCPHCENTFKAGAMSYHLKHCKMSKVIVQKRNPVWYQDCQPLKDDETDEQVKCEGCEADVTKLDDALEHLKGLAKDWNLFDFEERKIFRTDHFRCPICEEHKFDKKSQARFHLLVHVQEIHNDVRTCGVCSRSLEYPNVQKYLTHLKRHRRLHQGLKMKECPRCKKSYKAFSYHNHVRFCERMAKNEYLLCEFCSFKTLHSENLKQHLANIHESERLFPCDKCEKKFYFKSLLRKHVMKDHENFRSVCDECGNKFKDKKYLNNHIRLVHLNLHRFKCGLCQGKFKTRNAIRKHVQIHGIVNLYKCSVCGEEFRINGAAYRHRIKMHGAEGKILKNDPAALKMLTEKLIVPIEPEENEYGARKPRTTKAEPFVGALH